MVEKAHMNELFRVMVSKCKENLLPTDDAVLEENVLDMLRAPRDKDHEKRVQWAWNNLAKHGGEMGSLYRESASRYDSNSPIVRVCPMLFIDSMAKLLVSHDRTQPGDMVVEVEGSASSFVSSSPTEQFEWGPAHHYFESTNHGPSEDNHWLPNRSYLFLGVCSIYPGKTRYHASVT
jgi:hypothetical protein